MADRPDTGAWFTPDSVPLDLNGPANHPYAPPPADFSERPIFTILSEVAARSPHAIALVSGTREVTYGTLHRNALSLAARLSDAVPSGGSVAVMLADDLDVATAWCACLAAGRLALLLSAEHPAEHLEAILAEAEADVVLRDDSAPAPEAKGFVIRYRINPVPPLSEFTPTPLGVDEPGVVVYTSGSTGRAKGIVRTQRQLLSRANYNIQQNHSDRSDRVLSLFRMTSATGTTGSLSALLVGATLHVSDVKTQGLRKVLRDIGSQRILNMAAPPAMLRALASLPTATAAFSSLRCIYLVSDTVLPTDIIALRRVLPAACSIRVGYGMSEASAITSWFVPVGAENSDLRLPIGHPCALYDIAIVDEDCRAVHLGDVGALWVRGYMVSPGEWRHGRCVTGRGLPDPLEPGSHILNTGDLVRQRPDGMLEFVGRADEMVKVRGHRVEPAEIEGAIRRYPDTADAAVIARHENGETCLVAYVVAAPDALLDVATLRAHLRTSIPGFMVPAHIFMTDALPRLPSGKLDRARLRALDSGIQNE